MTTERPPSEPDRSTEALALRIAWGSALLTLLIWATLVLLLVMAEGIADPGPICYDRNPRNEVWCD